MYALPALSSGRPRVPAPPTPSSVPEAPVEPSPPVHVQRSHSSLGGERNFLAALLHLAAITLLCVATTQLEWFSSDGPRCPRHIGLYQFFDFGYFDSHSEEGESPGNSERVLVYHGATGAVHCVSPHAASVMHGVVAFCFLGVLASLWAFFMDALGPSTRALSCIRRNGIPSIIAASCVVGVVGLSYYAASELEQQAQNMQPTRRVEVVFGRGYFLAAAAGAMAVLGAACNLLRLKASSRSHSSPHHHLSSHSSASSSCGLMPWGWGAGRGRMRQSEGLLDDWDNGTESFVAPPPPPYVP